MRRIKERMKQLIEKTMQVQLDVGLQARSAAQFVQEANRYAADVFIEKSSKRVNAKSIMGLMSLAITKGETITLISNGEDEEAAIDNLTEFISRTTV